MREIRTFGSLRGEGGNLLAYSTCGAGLTWDGAIRVLYIGGVEVVRDPRPLATLSAATAAGFRQEGRHRRAGGA
jgi:hypothetical protein